MPPQRTNSHGAVTKPARTERTHEENQERAYIAASRRSDRSLEARIESARRASEIHKKRTGRALRVTEQDVINEEMYEEEEDDLPAHYRRLRHNLYAQGLVMNPSWEAASMINLFMRESVLNGNMHNQMQRGYPSQPFFAYQHPGQPAVNPYQQQQTGSQSSPSTSYRHQPYPMPPRSQQHQRSASIATPQEAANTPHGLSPTTPDSDLSDEQRRMSLPVQPTHSAIQMPNSNQVRPQLSRAPSSSSGLSPSQFQLDMLQQQQCQQAQYSPSVAPSFFDPLSQSFSVSPLTTVLPPEQQQIWGPVLSPSNPATSFFMNGSNQIAQPFTYNYHSSGKPHTVQSPVPSAMNQTLSANPLGIPASEATCAPKDISASATAEPFDNVDPEWTSYNGGLDVTTDFFNSATENPNSILANTSAPASGTIAPSFGMNDGINDFLNFESFDSSTNPA